MRVAPDPVPESRTHSRAEPAAKAPEIVDLVGFSFLRLTESECVQLIAQKAAAGAGGWVITPNLDVLRQCVTVPAIGRMAREADVLVADGMPLIWASRLQRTPLPERVCGSNLISSLSAEAAKRDLGLFLLGGADDTAERAARTLQAAHPGLRITGTYYPPFGFEKDQDEVNRMAAAVSQAEPDIILVALSFPKGEFLIQRIREACPQAWWVGVGISFSFISGQVKRAPRWMQVTGVEWVHRLSQEPKRMMKRYLVHDVPFALRLLAGAARRGLARR